MKQLTMTQPHSHHSHSHHSHSHSHHLHSHSHHSHHSHSHPQSQSHQQSLAHPQSHPQSQSQLSNITCRNCGIKGHLYKECPYPITSYGIICYRVNPLLDTDNKEYLLIQRKDSLSFMEFIRGKYDLKNIKYIKKLIHDITFHEKKMLQTMQFEALWNHVWYQQSVQRHTNEFMYAKIKFDALKVGLYVEENGITSYYNMNKIIAETPSEYVDPEWGFPKGRRRIREEDVDCAVREFSEETGIDPSSIVLHPDKKPYVEVFFGTNHVLYRHIYFIAKIANYNDSLNLHIDLSKLEQVREVRAVDWFSHDQILQHIRQHNQERKNIFKQIHQISF